MLFAIILKLKNAILNLNADTQMKSSGQPVTIPKSESELRGAFFAEWEI